MTPEALEWVARFRRHLATERRLSPHTDSNYARDLAALVKFCEAQGITEWRTLDNQHVRMFAARSHAQGLGPRSIQRRLSALRSFCEFLTRERVIQRNPGHDVRAPKAPKRLPDTLDVDQMARLLEIPAVQVTAEPSPEAPSDEEAEALSARDRALMELLYSSGLRLAELVALDTADVDRKDRLVHVRRGKGGKGRSVPVGSKALAALEQWLPVRAELAKPEEHALFVSRHGRRLGERAVQKRIAHWGRQQGVRVQVHPHMFRHSFASHLLESSGELRGVQELLGHANISTTQIYTHLDFQHLARIYDAAHPRARKKTG